MTSKEKNFTSIPLYKSDDEYFYLDSESSTDEYDSDIESDNETVNIEYFVKELTDEISQTYNWKEFANKINETVSKQDREKIISILNSKKFITDKIDLILQFYNI